MWERLERVEESYRLEVQRAMVKFDKGKGGRGDRGTCPLPPEAESEGGRGQGGGGGAGGEAGARELATLCQLQVPIHWDLDWVVRGEVALDCWESQEPLGEEDVSWEEAFKSFRGGSVSTRDVLVGLVADLLGPEEDLLGYLKEREGIPTGGLYSPSDSL